MVTTMDSSKPSSGHLAENIGYILSMSPDVLSMSVYSKTTTRGGDERHVAVHDAIRSVLLASGEPEISAHIGKLAYAAARLGDDQYVVCWRTGADFAKSWRRAVRRAIKSKKSPIIPRPKTVATAPAEPSTNEAA